MYLLILLFILIFLLLFIAFAAYYLVPFFYIGPPFVASSDKKTKKIIKLLNPKPGEKIVDLGSGDGKLLFEIAKKGAVAYGYEVNPILVFRTRQKIESLGLKNKVFVERADFFGKDLSKFDAVVVYGITYIMPRLEKKLLSELKPGTRIISNHFKFPNLMPQRKMDEILLYSSISTDKSR